MLDNDTREVLLAVRDEAESAGTDASFVLHRENSHLLRMGNSSVSLSTSEKLSRLDIRVIVGRKEGSHTHLGEIRNRDTVRSLLHIARAKAEAAMEKSFEPILELVQEPVDEGWQNDPGLAGMEPSCKTGIYREIFESVGDQYVYSGAWSSGSTELYLISSANANEAYRIGTDQQFGVVLKHPESGWELRSDATGWREGDVSAERASGELSSLVELYESTGGRKIEPGDYTVIFGPTAIAEILQMAAFTGFSGRLYEEKHSWTASAAAGDVVLGENITIVDDPSDELTFGHGFDLGGIRRSRYPIVTEGRLSGLMYDLATAAKFGKDLTGHELRSPSFVLATGDGPGNPLDAVRGRGGTILFIPALHYMNIPNISQGSFTGSSRFNATVVEEGAIRAPLLSSRITDTFPRLLSNVSLVSPEAVSVNLSNTYERRAPVAASVPSYMVAEDVRITDCADSF